MLAFFGGPDILWQDVPRERHLQGYISAQVGVVADEAYVGGGFIAPAFGAIYLSLVIAAVGAAAMVSMVIAGAFV